MARKLVLRTIVRGAVYAALLLSAPLVSLAQPASPTLTFSAAAAKVAVGKSTTLRWSSTNATACTASGAWSTPITGTKIKSGTQSTGNLTAARNEFTLTCSGAGGSVTRSVIVETVSVPVLTLTVSDTGVNPGQSVMLNWSAPTADSCAASGGWTGAKVVTGSETISNLTKGAKTYTLSCKNVAGTDRESVKVDVVPVPVVTFSARPESVLEGKTASLRWSATDATECVASGGWSGKYGKSGSFTTPALKDPENVYAILCTGPGGEDSASVTVRVVAAPTVELTLDQDVIAPSESVKINWSTTDAYSCKASGAWSGNKSASGSETLSNLTKGNKSFTLTCTGGGGSAKDAATLQVIPKPTLKFDTSAKEVARGKSATLKWSTTDVTACTSSGDWSGPRNKSGSFPTGPLTQESNVYELDCEGPNGEISASVTVNVIPAPTVTLELSDTLIEPGESVTIEWTSEDARSCKAGGGTWSGDQALSGTATIPVTAPGNKTITLTCVGAGGPTTVSRPLSVFPVPVIKDFVARPPLVQVGQTTTLSWDTSFAISCTASGAWTDAKPTSSKGVQSAPLTQRTNTFRLTCNGDGGEVSKVVVVQVEGAPKVTLSADRSVIAKGEPLRLTWSSENATSCKATGAWSGDQAVSGSVSLTDLPVGVQTFTLQCVNAVAQETQSVTVYAAVPQGVLSAGAITFGDASPQQTLAREVALRNPGKLPLAYQGTNLTGTDAASFTVDASACTTTIAPSAQCVIKLGFRPATGGVKNATLHVATDAGEALTVALSGRGAFSNLTITKAGTGSGTVTSSPAGINCGAECTKSYNRTSTVVLTAVAADNSTFTGWSGACTGTASCRTTMSEARSATATFELKSNFGVALTVTKTGTGSGSVRSTPAGIECGADCTEIYLIGTSVTLTATAVAGSVFAGWNGACRGVGTCEVSTDQALSVGAAFVTGASISGRVDSFNARVPAFVTLVSAADDSELTVAKVDSGGAFKFENLDPSKDYFLKFQQSGYRSVRPLAVAATSSVARSGLSRAQIASTLAVTPSVRASPGSIVNFSVEPIPGLENGKFLYQWQRDPTVAGVEFSTPVTNPVKPEILGKAEYVTDDQAAVKLAEQYGIFLKNETSAGAEYWTQEYAARLLQSIEALGLPKWVGIPGDTAWASKTTIFLVDEELPDDISKSTDKFLGGIVKISKSAFKNSTPQLARIEGERGVFYSNRLFRATLRIASNDGQDRTLLVRLLKTRYGIEVAESDGNAILVKPRFCPGFPSECEASSWRAFKPSELIFLAEILEEFPPPLLDLSLRDKPYGMRYMMRRQDGTVNPYIPNAGAVADITANYVEWRDGSLGATRRAGAYRTIVHEKAHFIFATLMSNEMRKDWLRLSGWFPNAPRPGQESNVEPRCDLWVKDPGTWSPPNLDAKILEFLAGTGHFVALEDDLRLWRGWGSCEKTSFVSSYATTNPNEDFADSMASFMLQPDLIRSVAPKKYEFIKNNLMQGSRYISKIREDLTFEVFNLYPDYTYPGNISALKVEITGAGEDNKLLNIRVEVAQADCASGAKNCPDEVMSGTIRIIGPYTDTPYPQQLGFGLGKVGRNVLEGGAPISKYAAAGWWQAQYIEIRDAAGNVRVYKPNSKDFGWRMYVDSKNPDVVPPKYVPKSAKLLLVDKQHPFADPTLGDGEREIILVARAFDQNPSTPFGLSGQDTAACIGFLAGKKGSPVLRLIGAYELLDSPQQDGANVQCRARVRVTKFTPTDEYFLTMLYIDDDAKNRADLRFALNPNNPSVEESPVVLIDTADGGDTRQVEVDVAVCKSSDPAERCIRVAARPARADTPDGETIVDFYYWAYERPPVGSASGLDFAQITLRDPLGREESYMLVCGRFGVDGRCPKLQTGGVIDYKYSKLPNPFIYRMNVVNDRYFSCPDSAPQPCDATTAVQYHGRVVLPVGSAPGIWGIPYLTVIDKVGNGRTYNFTELFRFDPTKTSSSLGSEKVGLSNSSGSLTFEVGAGAANIVSGAVEGGDIRNMDKGQLKFNARGSPKVSATSQAPVSTSISSGSLTASTAIDELTGSKYRVTQKGSSAAGLEQRWVVEYMGSNDELFGAVDLPITSSVQWRLPWGLSTSRSTTGWATLCSDVVWTVQDGYRLLIHRFDKTLTVRNQNDIEIARSAEVSLATDAGCGAGGTLKVSGFVFGVSDSEPPLSAEPVNANRFEIELGRSGEVFRKTVIPTEFYLPSVCETPKPGLIAFCTEAKRAVGW